jgi:hypothetical protein
MHMGWKTDRLFGPPAFVDLTGVVWHPQVGELDANVHAFYEEKTTYLP